MLTKMYLIHLSNTFITISEMETVMPDNQENRPLIKV